MSDDFESALRRALRRRDPGEELPRKVLARLDSSAMSVASPGRRDSSGRHVLRSRWLPVALAAGIVAAVGVIQIRQHTIAAARATRARAQLLQALSIVDSNINIVRAAVAREEHPDS